MSVVIKIEWGSGQPIERSITAEQALGIVALLVADAAADEPTPLALKRKKAKRAPKDKTERHDEEGPVVKVAHDREAVKRLIKGSDLSVKEIAEKAGCSAAYVYMVRNAMQRAGELG